MATSAQPGSTTTGSATTLGAGLPQLTLPYCAMQTSSFAGCELPHPTVGLPTGDRELSSLSVGDVLGIYDYAVFVTKVGESTPGGGSPLSGEGLARLPFLNGTMVLVEFSGVSAKAGEPGTNGGCVYAISPTGTSMPGYFRIKRASQAEVLAQQRNLIASLISQQTSSTTTPGSSTNVVPFVGTLGEALAKYDSVVVGIHQPTSQTISTETRQALVQYTAAIAQGSAALKTSFESVYGDSRDALVISIRDSLAVLMSQVQSTLTNLQSGSAVTDLSALTARYEALFAQLKKLTNPTTTTPINLTATYGIRNVTLTNVNTTSAGISWQADPAFTKYVVTYQIQNGSPTSQTISSSQLALKKLKAGTNYTFTILAYQGDKAVSSYGPALFVTPPQVLDPPQNLAYTLDDSSSVTITWDKNKEHLGYKLVYKGEDGIERFAYPTTNKVKLKGLDLAQNYTYDIVAYDKQNNQSARVASEINTCQLDLFLVAKETTKVNEPAKVNEKITLRSGGCASGTILWQDTNGNLLGTGNDLVIRPIEMVSLKTICTTTGCESKVMTIPVAITLPSPLVCEDFTVSASPQVINKGEQNTVFLTASGCTNGTISWNGPGLAPNTPGQGQYQSVTVSDLRDAATYTAQCKKVGFDPIPAQVEVKAELRFTLTASPNAVKKGASTTLKVDGCVGGTLTWTNLPTGCSVAPCSVSVKITDPPIIFEAICTSGADRKSAIARVDLVNDNGSTVTNSACANFVASVTPNGTEFFEPTTTFSLNARNCPGAISWSAQSSGFTRTVSQRDRPGISTTYYVTCRDATGTISAYQQFPVNVHQSSCPDFSVDVNPTSKPTSSQVGGSNSSTSGVWTGIVATSTGKYYAIQTNGCKSRDRTGSETISVQLQLRGFQAIDLPSNTYLVEVDPGAKLIISCIANPAPPYDKEVCTKTIDFSNLEQPQVSNARVAASADSTTGDSTQASGAARQAADLAGCTGSLPMAGVMAGYFQTFICDNISLLLDSDGNPSRDKVNILLQALPGIVKNSPSLNYGSGVDFSAITVDQLLAALKLKSPDRCAVAGEVLGSAFKSQSSAYEYSAGIIPGYASINHALKAQLSSCSDANQAATSNYQPDDKTVTVQFNASSKAFTFNFLSGVKASWTNNRLTVSAVPAGQEKWRGDYIAYFDSENHDVFLGFYKVNYTGECTASYTVSTTAVNTCTRLCQKGFLPNELFRGGNKFYRDFGLASGSYYKAGNSQTLITQIDDLVEQMMDQGIYDDFLKAGAAVFTSNQGPVTDKNLQDLLTILQDYQQVSQSVFSKTAPSTLSKLITFFKLCSNYKDPDNPACITDGIVPRCLWDTGVPFTYPLSAPFTAGIIDGGYQTITGFKDLFVLYAQFEALKKCWFDPVTFIFPSVGNCGAIRQTSKAVLSKLADLITDPDLLQKKAGEASSQIGTEFFTWLEQLTCSDAIQKLYQNGTGVVPAELYADLRCCQYQQGKLAFDVASLLYGVGEANVATQVGSKLSSFWQVVKKVPALLKRINLPSAFSLKPLKKVGLALFLTLANPTEVKALQLGTVQVVNGIERITLEKVASEVAPSGGRALSRATEIAQGVELANGGEKLADIATRKFINETAEEAVISADLNGTLVALLAINKTTGVIQKISSDCPICQEKQPSAYLCNKLVQLQSRGGSNGTQGVQKLCDNLDNIRLDALTDKLLNTYTNDEITAFLGDVVNAQTNGRCTNNEVVTLDLSDRVGELTPELLDGWLVYKRGSRNCLRVDMSKLQKAAAVLANASLRKYNVTLAALSGITKATGETYALSNPVAQRMDTELVDNLLRLGQFLDQNPTTQLIQFDRVLSQLQTSTFYKQKGANWVIKNIGSDATTFAGKWIGFEVSFGGYYVDVAVYPPRAGIDFLYLIEYKSGPGATICEYINEDGKQFGNLIRELVSRDLNSVNSLAQLQWRLEQPPANLQTLFSDCLKSQTGLTELNKLGVNKALQLFPDDPIINNANFVQQIIANIDSNFNRIFKIYP